LEHTLLEMIGEPKNVSKNFCSELTAKELPMKHALLAKHITMDALQELEANHAPANQSKCVLYNLNNLI